MSTQPVCEKCGGTGWIIVERSSVSGAERCACLSEGRAARLEERSQIPPLYRNASFENFKTEGVQELKRGQRRGALSRGLRGAARRVRPTAALRALAGGFPVCTATVEFPK